MAKKNRKNGTPSFKFRAISMDEYLRKEAEGIGADEEADKMKMHTEESEKHGKSEKSEKNAVINPDILKGTKPKDIKAFLDDYVVGQEYAKKSIAVAVYNHYVSALTENDGGVELKKSNILLMGPSGCGKTHIVQSVARMLKVPFVSIDCTSLAPTSFKGDNVNECVHRLMFAAGEKVAVAERGIIYLDEIDKVAQLSFDDGVGRAHHQSLQHSLLKLLEGTSIKVSAKEEEDHGYGPVCRNVSKLLDTSKILFVCAGAFVGLEDIVAKRLGNGKKTMGFCDSLAEESNVPNDTFSLLRQVRASDLIKFGFIPELVGRIPVIVPTSNLGVEDLARVLTEPKNSIVRQYAKRMGYENVEFEVTPEAAFAIADTALRTGVGARGLQGVLESVMMEVMYEVPSLSGKIAKVVLKASCSGDYVEPEYIER